MTLEKKIDELPRGQVVRIGLQRDLLDIGDAVKMSSRWTYNISPAKLARRQGMTVEEMERTLK